MKEEGETMREENNHSEDKSTNDKKAENNSSKKNPTEDQNLNIKKEQSKNQIPSREEIKREREKRLARIRQLEDDVDQEMAKKYPDHAILNKRIESKESPEDDQINTIENDENESESNVVITPHPSRRKVHQSKNRQDDQAVKESTDQAGTNEKVHTAKEADANTTLPVVQAAGQKSTKASPYSLKEYDTTEKVDFSFKVLFGVLGKLILYITVIVLLIGALVGGAGIGYFVSLVKESEPPTEQTLAEQLTRYEEQSVLYYGDGNPIADIQTDVVRTETNLEAVSPYIVDGLIATEDEYFYEHPGIVPKAILRAALESLFTQSGTGGSTLTQQLVKQQLLSNEVTFARKANEILLALRVENFFEKDDILMAYLNVSPFGRNNRGENIAGIEAAARGIFGVNADEVSLPQAAFLVGLPQDPYVYTPYSQTGEKYSDMSAGIERMHEVLFRMYRNQDITQDEYEEAVAYNITADFIATESIPEERSSYLYNTVFNGALEKIMEARIAEDGLTREQVWANDELYNEYYFSAEEELRTGGYHVYSTIDKEIYDQLQSSAQAYESDLGVYYDGIYVDPETGQETYYVERIQTGLVVIDNPTGRVLGFVAGTDFENNQIDHAFNMHRSPGSTIKPLVVYGPAVEHNIINPATMIPDTAFVQTFEDGSTWQPTNYGMTMSNENMSARRALYRSDNIPAVRIYEENLRQGVSIIDYLERMGFDTIESYTEEETHNLAFSLGGVTTGPTVFEQTSAFTTFANNGQYVDGYYIERIEDADGNVVFEQNVDPVTVFSEDSNYLMVDMLRDTMDEGTGRTATENMVMGGDWIAKSGISENSKDIWFLASTPQITIGSWIGYDSRFADYTINVNDGFGLESVRSQVYWARIVNDLYGIRPEIFGTDLAFQQPASVQQQSILEQTGTLPGSVNYNGRTIQLTGPLRDDLFKVSNPAPPLTLDFIFNGTPEEQAAFWNGQVTRIQEQQNQNNNNSSSSSSGDSTDENGDESTENQDESNGNGEGEDTEEITPPEVIETTPSETPPTGE